MAMAELSKEETEAAIMAYMLGQASAIIDAARRGEASMSTWQTWAKEWSEMWDALLKSWKSAEDVHET